MTFNELFPEYTNTPKTLGPHQPICIGDNIAQSWAKYTCLVCNNTVTGWRIITSNVPAMICSIECLAEYNLNNFDAIEQDVAESKDIIECLDNWSL